MSAAAVSKRHSPDPASEDSVDARTTRPHRKPLAAQSPRQRPERSCLAPRTAQHRAPQGLKWLSFTPDSGLKLRLLPLAKRPSNSAIRAAISSGVKLLFVSLAIV